MDLKLRFQVVILKLKRMIFEVHSPSRGHERPYLCFGRHFKNRGLGTPNCGLGLSKPWLSWDRHLLV